MVIGKCGRKEAKLTKKLRKYSSSKIYHIIIKGIDNQNIFYDDQDRRVFLNDILKTKKEFNYQICSYSLMDNHVHLVIRIEKEFLSKAMQSLMVRYVRYFNKKYKRIGTLAQSRFKSKNVENQKYFLEVCRYVHQNPENAGIAKTEEYKWSSYQEYLGKERIIDKNILLHYFDNDINKFIEYNTKNDTDQKINEFAEYEMIGKLTDEQLAQIIMQKFFINDVSEIPNFFKNLNKKELENNIAKLKNIKGTNKTQLARIIRVGRRIIEKIWQ